MDLILWRHAEAEEWKEGCNDLERSLTSRGEKQAARMSQWLDRQLPEGVRILCSPARRTEQTVLALGRKYKLRNELAPDGTVEQLLELVQWPSSRQTFLVVGHQPLLGQTISQLVGLKEEECTVRKGAVWWLRLRERAGVQQTVVVTVQSPELL
ncbi:SixA phosphatase family protein [Variovorax sp. VNK109]|jgi:phosphohistidine phosphatase|uniref:SixA phosphatase family protein n=1 Tax=Variovorax sp. VNK109 TaxID=3400919 RepID=UPI003C099AE1